MVSIEESKCIVCGHNGDVDVCLWLPVDASGRLAERESARYCYRYVFGHRNCIRAKARRNRRRRSYRQFRMVVYARDNWRCVSCGATEDLTLDHIVPKSKGGPHTPENLQTMCRPCNNKKGNTYELFDVRKNSQEVVDRELRALYH